MNREIINTIILATSFLALFGLAELIYHLFKVRAELTRKLVHFGTGILTLLFPILLDNHWLVLFLCGSFALILILSLKFNLLKSINAIDRKSYGSISYPLAVYLCYLAYDFYRPENYFNGKRYIIFYLPILILAICDPIAALTGKRWQIGKYTLSGESKTFMGSSMFFISAFLLSCFMFLNMNYENSIYQIILASLVISIITTITEAFSKKGLDNLFIPMSGILSLYIINETLLYMSY